MSSGIERKRGEKDRMGEGREKGGRKRETEHRNPSTVSKKFMWHQFNFKLCKASKNICSNTIKIEYV